MLPLIKSNFRPPPITPKRRWSCCANYPIPDADQAACMLNLARAAQQTGDYQTATQWLNRHRPGYLQTTSAFSLPCTTKAANWLYGRRALPAGSGRLPECPGGVARSRTGAGQSLSYETVCRPTRRWPIVTGLWPGKTGAGVWKTVLDCVRQAVAQLEDLKGHFEAEHSLPEAQHTFSRLFDLGVEAGLALADPVEAWRWSEHFKSNFQQQLAWRALHWSTPASLPEQVAAVQHARQRLALFPATALPGIRSGPIRFAGAPAFGPAGLDDSIRFRAEQCRQVWIAPGHRMTPTDY
ncbi:MAG: hypothetical protein R3D58_16265 [Saprospiraceae bacterium]